MLGQPLYMLMPEVVGMQLTGSLPAGATATDLVLPITEILHKRRVGGKFVEVYGPAATALTGADRATVRNMSPEYGATCGFFPIDAVTLAYLAQTGRSPADIDLVERYTKAQKMFRTDDAPAPVYTSTLSLDLSTVVPSMAGPKRPQDRVAL